MGCHDGAEFCKLIGSYLLNKLSKIVDKKLIGLDRVDGLAILQKILQTERKRRMFKSAGLNITIQAG